VLIVGSDPALGAWQPPDGLPLVRGVDGVWRGTARIADGAPFEFKVTRGGWETVEKGPQGQEVPNRAAVAGPDVEVAATVARWNDLP
jgi:hypothetical protein